MSNPPKKIYLQCFDEDNQYLDPAEYEITWCIDKIGDNDAEYSLVTKSMVNRKITTIQPQLRQLRFDANMTLKEVADFVGCSPALVAQWENGRSEPTFQTIAKLSACYGFICTVRFEVNDD